MRLGVVQAIFARLQRPFPPGSDDLQIRRQRLVGVLETDLVVALAGAAMGDRFGALLQRQFYLVLGDHRPRDRGAQQVLVLIDCAGTYRRIHVVAHELIAQVEHHRLLGAGGIGFIHHCVQVFALAHIGNHGNYIHAVVLIQPGNDDRGVEPT